jgi:transcriptional regulator with XRE-family HTH domain
MRARAFEGDRLRRERENRGFTQVELGTRIGTGPNQINRYENGQADPSLFQLKRLAKELQVTTDYLLGLVDHKDEHIQEPELSLNERKFLTALRQKRLATLLRMLNQALPEIEDEPEIASVDDTVNGNTLDVR